LRRENKKEKSREKQTKTTKPKVKQSSLNHFLGAESTNKAFSNSYFSLFSFFHFLIFLSKREIEKRMQPPTASRNSDPVFTRK
jgi:hypothetical protein